MAWALLEQLGNRSLLVRVSAAAVLTAGCGQGTAERGQPASQPAPATWEPPVVAIPPTAAIAIPTQTAVSGANPVTELGIITEPDPWLNVPSPAQPVDATPAVPLLGGTLLVTSSGQHAVLARPEASQLVVVNLEYREVELLVTLPTGSQPARLVEDTSQNIHVVLRGVSGVASIHLPSALSGSPHASSDLPEAGGTELEAASGAETLLPLVAEPLLRYACPEPRGLAFDKETERLVVACKSGEVVWFAGDEATPTRQLKLTTDLRDVTVIEGNLYVSTFKEARVLEVQPDGVVVRNMRPNVVSLDPSGVAYEPRVAHRMMATDQALVLQHQRASRGELTVAYYSATDCAGGITNNTVSVLPHGESLFHSVGLLPGGSMLDMAITRDGDRYALLMTAENQSAVHSGSFDQPGVGPCDPPPGATQYLDGHVTALAFDGEGRLLAQRRVPASLEIVGVASIALDGAASVDAGLELFYRPTSRGVSCATCHPEGEEDGVTWNFTAFGLRRTQSVSGQVSPTAPLHWEGDRGGMSELLSDTLVGRMGGEAPSEQQVAGITRYLDGLRGNTPMRSSYTDEALAGRRLFEDLQCGSCHAGPLFTDNYNHDVGTGGEFQTPSLRGVAYRAPFMHDGCAETLRERFSACGGDERHGDVSSLSDEESDLLIAYLETL
jgi:hypothetical protein